MKEIVIEGLLSIQAGENPRVIEEKLKSFLAPAQDSFRVKAKVEMLEVKLNGKKKSRRRTTVLIVEGYIQ